jgi:hypothetical protein
MDAAAPNATAAERHPYTQPASSCDFSGYSVRTRFLIMIAAAIAPWALAFGVAKLIG